MLMQKPLQAPVAMSLWKYGSVPTMDLGEGRLGGFGAGGRCQSRGGHGQRAQAKQRGKCASAQHGEVSVSGVHRVS
jgi:hypothetical protein